MPVGPSLDARRERAQLLARIRAYFDSAGVLEVTTPVLSGQASTEPALTNVRTVAGPGMPPAYLRTSPESALKRLVAAGSGDVYELGPVFRAEEAGRVHLPEFTLLEWYRVGFDHERLMDDVESLLQAAGFTASVARLAYADLWADELGGDPHTITTERLAALTAALPARLDEADRRDRAALFDAVYAQVLEPALARAGAVFLYGYPREQRAYARLSGGGTPVAERFELVIDGLEIANGYHEIVDAAEQRACFAAENARRSARGLDAVPPDEAWLAALASGMPPCAGVALGIERLHLALRGGTTIAAVAGLP